MARSWYRAMYYRGGKPNRVTRGINSRWAWLCSRGILPQFLVTLEPRGRRTGHTHRIPLVAADLGGSRCIVSMLGENVDWVRNVRAANGEAVIRYGSIQKVTLREIPINERAPILKAYLAKAPGARPHFEIDWDAPMADFERVAARYPVFEIVPPTARA